MSKAKKILVAVAWPYVNGDLHLGHLAGYLLPADIFARWHRFVGNDVLMVSGSDCFGTPVALEADKRGLKPIDIIEEYHPKNVALFKSLNLDFDIYTRTDNPIHQETVQDIFVSLLEKKLIYHDTSEQYYSETENKFLPDRYVEGTCPHCGYTEARSDQCDNCDRLITQGELIKPISKLTKTPVVLKSSEHYFFDWPKLESFLKDYVKSYGSKWRPWIYNEVKRWLAGGLRPRAITRDLNWGVMIPSDRIAKNQLIEGHEHKRIYVWFEAVIGYLSASIQYSREHNNEIWKDFWYEKKSEHYYFMGKDNLVFHTLFWPGQLHGYDTKLHLPDVQAINQFLTLGNEGFSKSHGITLNPLKMAQDFGLDVIRFYISLIMPENHDTDFTWSDFIAKTNNLLIANLGNFLFRTLKLCEDLDFKNTKTDKKIIKLCQSALDENSTLMSTCSFRNYAERILDLSSYGNKYLSDLAPWKVKKTDEKKYQTIMANAALISLTLLVLIKPIMPDSFKALAKMMSIEIKNWPNVKILTKLLKQVEVKHPQPLFKKIESDPEIENFNEKYR